MVLPRLFPFLISFLLLLVTVLTAVPIEAQLEGPQGSLERITVAHDGGAANGPSYLAVISADGRYVAFASDATNLVNDGRGKGYFIYDRQTGQTSRIMLDWTWHRLDMEWGFIPLPIAISDDGRSIGFLVDDHDGFKFLIYDQETRQIDQPFNYLEEFYDEHLSINSYVTIVASAGNRYVAISTLSRDNNSNYYWDGTVHLHDMQLKETSQIALFSSPTNDALWAEVLAISADGNYIAYLVGTTLEDWAIFIHDRQIRQDKLVTSGDGVFFPGGYAPYIDSYSWGDISADGRYFAFWLSPTEWIELIESNAKIGWNNYRQTLLYYDFQTDHAEYIDLPFYFPLEAIPEDQHDFVPPPYISHVSTDGHHLFFFGVESLTGMTIYNRLPGTFEQLPSAPFFPHFTRFLNSSISIDGRYIVYHGLDEEQEMADLYIYDRWPHLPHTYDPDYVPPLTAGDAPPLDSDTGLPADDSALSTSPGSAQTTLAQPSARGNFTLSEAVIYWRETPWLFWGSLSVGGLSLLLLALLGVIAWRSLSAGSTNPQPAPVTNRPLCPNCGQPLPGVGTFCGQCGHRLTNTGPAEPPSKAPLAPAPVDTAAYTTRGIAQVRAGELAAAVVTLRQVIDQEPTNSEAWLWLGFAYGRQGNRPLAERCFNKARQLGSNQAIQALDWLKRQ
jgi:hypothetical protein